MKTSLLPVIFFSLALGAAACAQNAKLGLTRPTGQRRRRRLRPARPGAAVWRHGDGHELGRGSWAP